MLPKTYNLFNIEVFAYNLEPQRSWVTADKLCRYLGKGWRLPSPDELHYLFDFYNNGLLNLNLVDIKTRNYNINIGNYFGYWSNSISGDPGSFLEFECEVYYFARSGQVIWEPGMGSVFWNVRPVRSII